MIPDRLASNLLFPDNSGRYSDNDYAKDAEYDTCNQSINRQSAIKYLLATCNSTIKHFAYVHTLYTQTKMRTKPPVNARLS